MCGELAYGFMVGNRHGVRCRSLAASAVTRFTFRASFPRMRMCLVRQSSQQVIDRFTEEKQAVCLRVLQVVSRLSCCLCLLGSIIKMSENQVIRNLKPVFEESLEPVKKSRIVNALSDINSNLGSPFRLTPKPAAHIASREIQHKDKIPKTVRYRHIRYITCYNLAFEV